MDGARNIPDSTDWLNTPLEDFAHLESALHCQICKEFYDTPMTTSCSHTFCSRCIRTSLTADGKCPACRTNDQANKLRNNWALQEVVAAFLAARPVAIGVARKEQEQANQTQRPGKRKRILDPEEMEHGRSEVRTTRSKSRRLAASQTSETELVEIDDTDDDGDFEPEPQPQDGLVECPLGCGKRMKIEQVEPHLDRCEDEKKQERRAKSRTPVHGFGSPRPSSGQESRPQERLAQLNYSLMKDNALRKKFEELGIPPWGSKQLLVRRHTEWVNLWNANCDSNQPRSKRELLQDLDTWERTQGGRAPNANGTVSGVMRKDFDGAGWANRNRDEFSRLIADARRMKSNPATTSSPPKDEPPDNSATQSTPPAADNDHPPTDTTTPNPSDPTQPYAENPEALTSIRQKVHAINAGHDPKPALNAGFRSSTPTNSQTSSKPSDPHPATQNTALLDQHHFGHPGQRTDEHTSHGSGTTGSPCDLPAHLPSASPRKVPMFAVPEEPMMDLDGGGGGGPAVQ